MHISKIIVHNFRLLKDFELHLEKNLSLVIGKNNCGKTSLLSLLDKFIGGKSSVNSFAWNDFSLAFQHELKCMVKNTSISKEEESLFPLGIALKLFIEYGETDNLSNISSIMMDLNPDNNTVVLEFLYAITFDSFSELVKDFQKHVQKLNDKRNSKPHPIEETAVVNDFSEYMKNEYKNYFQLTKYSREFNFVEKKEGNTRAIIGNDKTIEKIINFKLISARRTVSNSDTNNTLSILSSKYYENIEENNSQKQAIEEFKDAIGDTDQKLDIIYCTLFSGIVSKVKKFGGIKEGDSIIKILSSLQRKELLKGNTTVMYEHDNLNLLPENYNGLGYLNLISMIFEIEVKMASFRKDGKENETPADINLFFIEEPEAHTHPQMQYVFINNIKDILKAGCHDQMGNKIMGMQSIITTHSSHITSESEFNDIKYLCISENKYVYAKNLKDLEVEYAKDGDEGSQRFKFLKQYLTLNRSELFFADKAIFIEGDTERILLPAMMKKLDQKNINHTMPILSQNISIVEVGAYSHVFEKFIDFIGIKSLIVTDIDPAKTIIDVDSNGKAKLNAGGMPKQKTIGCPSVEGTTTTNAALKFFFSHHIAIRLEESGKKEKSKNILEILNELPSDQKSLKKDQNSKQWITSDSAQIMLAYQSKDTNADGKSYCANSFEDAFIHLNRKFIKDNISMFESLKNKSNFDDLENDPYNLASACIDKKTSFAMEILLASDLDENIEKYSKWETPHYIKEGLEWLKEN